MANLEEKIEILLKPTIEKMGYELYDVEYQKEGKNYFLRIFIDKPKGIDLQDCEKVNNEINNILDKADYIKEQYFLEVSSTGIEKTLKKDRHLQQQIGKEIKIKLFQKGQNQKKEQQGILKKFNSEQITIQNQEQEVEISRKDIAQIKTVYNWEKEE